MISDSENTVIFFSPSPGNAYNFSIISIAGVFYYNRVLILSEISVSLMSCGLKMSFEYQSFNSLGIKSLTLSITTN